MSHTNAEWIFVKYPDPQISTDQFELRSCPAPNPDELPHEYILIKLLYLSVDPYMRGRMNTQNYFTPLNIGDTMSGGITAQITHSKNGNFPVGANVVLPFCFWKKFQIVNPEKTKVVLLPPSITPTLALGICGMTGVSAYFPIVDIGQPKAGEVAFVSGAAGAVGLAAGQFLKQFGCTVIGCAGSDDKVSVLKEFGFDHAFNYKTTGLQVALKQYAPNGIDIYYDNVGGEFLDIALVNMRKYGRIILCGAISQYNKKKEDAYAIRNLTMAIGKELRMQGFLSSSYASRQGEFLAQVGKWLSEGKIKSRDTIVNGFEHASKALVDLFNGDNTGKMLVKA